MSTVYPTSYAERRRPGAVRGELHAVLLSTDPAEARSEAKGWRRTGYQARIYSRRPTADGVTVPVYLVVVRKPASPTRAGGLE